MSNLLFVQLKQLKIRIKNGFTLIELLIAIAIISLLFGIVLINSNALRGSSNDAKRKADLALIQSALQSYYADQNYYPSAITFGTTTSITSSLGAASPSPSPMKTYLNTLPNDTAENYCYYAAKSANGTAACDNNPISPGLGLCNYYYLSARLENPATGSSTLASDVTTCNTSTKNYMVTPNN